MDMNTYQDQTELTAIYPGAGTGSMTALAYLGLGLGEAGEVQGKIKKVMRDSGGVMTDEARVNLMHEIGDLLWYVARLSAELEIPLEAVASANLQKLSLRREAGTLQGSGDTR